MKDAIGRAPLSTAVQILAGFVCGGGLLWLTIRRVDLAQVTDTLESIDGRWIAVAVGAYVVALGLRTVRWWMILRAVVRIKLHQVGVALLLGYGLNALIPARLGELLRADYCGRRYSVSRSAVFGTILIERFMDGVILLCALTLGLSFIRLDGHTPVILHSLLVLGLLVFGGLGLLLLVLSTQLWSRLFASHTFVAQKLQSLSASLRLLRSFAILGIACVSVIVWAADGTALWAILRACGVQFSIVPMLVVIGIVSLASLLPSPPAFVGTMQFAFALSVSLVNGPASKGIAAAVANQLFLIVPLIFSALLLWMWLSWGPRRVASVCPEFAGQPPKALRSVD